MEGTEHRYPLRLTGELSPQLSRGLWLVKWLLAIPHFVLLFFLWIAFVVLSVAVLFAVLFTSRYPRAIFNFNVGVLRGHRQGKYRLCPPSHRMVKTRWVSLNIRKPE